MSKKKPLPSFAKFVERALNYRYFADLDSQDDEPAPITFRHGVGGDHPILVITGDNASGKSFFARLMNALASLEYDTEFMRLSMEGRATGGVVSAMIYGDEQYNSTGVLSTNVITCGQRTCEGRDKPHLICYDEPDIGLSEGYQAAMGAYIARFVENLPEKTKGVIVITHSKHIVRKLMSLNPHWIRVGDKMTVQEWLDAPFQEHTIEELESLSERAHETFLAIHRLQKEK